MLLWCNILAIIILIVIINWVTKSNRADVWFVPPIAVLIHRIMFWGRETGFSLGPVRLPSTPKTRGPMADEVSHVMQASREVFQGVT